MKFWDASAIIPLCVQETGSGMTAGSGLVAFDRRLRDASYAEGFTVLPETV